MENLAVIPFAILIGIVLGALGSGGAILALPILVYVAALPVRQAIGVSQFVVGSAAFVGTLLQSRQGNICWRNAVTLGLAGLPATALGSWVAGQVQTSHLMLGFAIIITLTGLRILMNPPAKPTGHFSLPISLLIGAIVGFLTGLLGVGGGFLLVPAMIAYSGLGARQATATSLPVIAVNSLAGAAQQHALWEPVLNLALIFLGATLVGTFIGLRLGRAASELKLKQALGILLIVVGLVVGVANVRQI